VKYFCISNSLAFELGKIEKEAHILPTDQLFSLDSWPGRRAVTIRLGAEIDLPCVREGRRSAASSS
jgi:hypothetical protein